MRESQCPEVTAGFFPKVIFIISFIFIIVSIALITSNNLYKQFYEAII